MFRNKTINMYFIRIFITTMLIPITISGVLHSYVLFQNSYKNATDYSSNAISKANLYLDLIINNTQSIANIISFNTEVQKTLMNNVTLESIANNHISPNSDNYAVWQNAKNLLTINLMSNMDLFSNAVIFNADGEVIMSLYKFGDNSTLNSYEWNDTLKNTNGAPIWISSHIDTNDLNSHQQYVITLARKIRISDEYKINSDWGYLIINLNEQYLYDMLSSLSFSKDSFFLILDEKNSIIIHNDEKRIGESFNIDKYPKKNSEYLASFNNQDVILANIKNKTTGWTLVEMVNFNIFFFDNIIYLISTLFITLCLLIIFIFASVRVSHNILKPIHELQGLMKIVEKGFFDIKFVHKSNIMEIDELMSHFYKMVFKLNNLIEEVYKSKLKEKELRTAVIQAELSALQQQVNPHFLYNTLDSINWLATLGANEQVSNMVTSLSDFFRYCISRGDHFVSIGDEVENIKNYIYMQQIRFGSLLAVNMEIQEDVCSFLTMKLLLQPIVENSIIHGIGKKSGKGKIIIRVYTKDSSVIFCVEDDGAGMDENTKEELLSPSKKERSVGLSNVIQRLKLFFNQKYSFNIESRLNAGTTVTIAIPIFKSEEELNRILAIE